MNKSKSLAKYLQICSDLNLKCTGCAFKAENQANCFCQLKQKAADELIRLDGENTTLKRELSELKKELRGQKK